MGPPRLSHVWSYGHKASGVESTRPKEGGRLVVCNHMSYLDPLMLAAQEPSIFVTSREVEASGFLERLRRSRLCICRSAKSSKHPSDMESIAELLTSGPGGQYFPRGNQHRWILHERFQKSPFRSSHFGRQSVVEPRVFPTQYLNSKPVTHKNRDTICWYGDMTFVPHFLQTLCRRSLNADIFSTGSHTNRLRSPFTQPESECEQPIQSYYQPIT